jgi:hypothetical protein
MPRNDYECDRCGNRTDDVFVPLSQIVKSIECGVDSCTGTLRIAFDNFVFNNHLDGSRHSKMYGKEYHNGFGCVVESYEHKQQLLKENDVSEAADPVGGSRSWRDNMPTIQPTQADTSQVLNMSDGEYVDFKNDNG